MAAPVDGVPGGLRRRIINAAAAIIIMIIKTTPPINKVLEDDELVVEVDTLVGLVATTELVVLLLT